jgi:CheY-like chemotaxis protein
MSFGGTAFLLNLHSYSMPDHPTNNDSELPGGNETLLIVEDQEVLLALLRSILEGVGYTVFTATDGPEAIEIYTLHKESISLMLSDMGLPTLGGWEAFLKIKEINPNVKAILASGFVEDETRDELTQMGVRCVIQKPYVTDILLQKIREVLEGE